jgi:hypothetical protein
VTIAETAIWMALKSFASGFLCIGHNRNLFDGGAAGAGGQLK